MPMHRPILLSLAGSVSCLLYWLIFLRQPLVEGTPELTRGIFVLNTLLLPESIVTTWTGTGRLPTGWLDRAPIVLSTLGWLTLAAIIGWPHTRFLLRRTAGSPASARTKKQPNELPASSLWPNLLMVTSVSMLVGLAVLSTVTLVIGLTGALSSPLPLIIALCLLLVLGFVAHGWPQRETAPITDDTAMRPTVEPPVDGTFDRALRLIAVALTLWSASAIMLGAWVPPAEFDVLEYHLQAPKEFYQQGSIDFVPHNVYANMPLAIEMHSLAAMTLWQQPDAWLGGLVGKSITASITLIGAALLGGWCAQRYGWMAGWWSAGIWLATPGIAHVATQGLIDGALATYCLACVLTAWQLIEAVRRHAHRAVYLRWATIVSLLGGSAAAIKYPGLILATLPCLACLSWCAIKLWLGGQRATVGWLICIVVGALTVTCLPWYAKNYFLAGNPVYPLAANLFGGETLTPEKIAQWQKAHAVPPASQLPSDVSRLLVTSSFVQPALVLGSALASVWLMLSWLKRWTIKDNSLYLMLAWSLWMLAVWWLATHRIDRFWLPITGLWALLAAWAMVQLMQTSQWLAHGIVLPGLLYGALINSSPVVTDNRYFVSLATLRDDTGDDENSGRVPLAQGWIHQHLNGQSVRIGLIGEARVFEYRVPVIYSTCFDANPVEAMLKNKRPSEQLAALKEAGVTHLMINWVEINRYRGPGNYGFSDWPTREDVQALIDNGVVRSVDWELDSAQAQLLEVED